MKKEVAFNSHYSFTFYLLAGFFLIVFGLSLYRFTTGGLDLQGFLFLTLLLFGIGEQNNTQPMINVASIRNPW